jgi:transcriptional regulator with XRE-family HTH domain
MTVPTAVSDLEGRWRDLGEFIREQRRVGQLSLRKLSEKAGISNPYLSQIERGLRKPSAEILQQIARALSISAETLYVRAGILDEPSGNCDLPAEIRRDPHLTEDQKRTLERVYQSFLKENTSDGERLAFAAEGRRPVPNAQTTGTTETPGPAERAGVINGHGVNGSPTADSGLAAAAAASAPEE